MSLTTTTGLVLILSTLIYHGGLAFLFARAQFGDWLKLPQRSYREKLLIIAKHPEEYRWGFRIILVGWVVAALGYVMLTVLLRDAGDPIISTLASVLFLMGIASAIAFWGFSLTANVLAAEEMARTEIMPEYYKVLVMSAESLLGVYQLLALLATAGFGWALLQTGILPNWVGWITLGWGILWAGVHIRSDETVPLLPMVMQIVIGISLLLK
jgi:hypothetical protein